MRQLIKRYRQKPKNTSEVPGRIYYAEHKYDGHRLTVFRENGQLYAIGRKVHIDLWPKIARYFDDYVLDYIEDGDAYDGELYSPGGSSNTATSIASGHYEGEVRFCSWGKLLYQKCFTGAYSKDAHEYFVNEVGFEYPHTIHPGRFIAEEDMLEYVNSNKLEGLVFKYQPFGDQWYKYKPQLTTDLIVAGFKEGDGALRGTLGSMVLTDYDGKELATVGQFPLTARKHIWEHKHQYLGRVCEVKYKSKQVHKLNHAVFLRWRDDKPAEECYL